MPFVQSIDNAREDRVGREGISAAALQDALARSGDALAWLRARHADGGAAAVAASRPNAPTLPEFRKPPSGCAKDASDIVFLGTGGSSLGGQALAQLADYAVPGIGALRAGRACISWTISIRIPLARCWQSCRSRPPALSRSPNPAAPARR